MTGAVVNWPAPPPLFAGDREPSTVAELESALSLLLNDATTEVMNGFLNAPRPSAITSGAPLSEAVQSLSVTFDWDMYHEQRCQTVADVRWPFESTRWGSNWTGDFAPRSQQRYGVPKAASKHYESRVFTYFVYGPFFVAPYGARGFSLTFYRKIPDWASRPQTTR